MGSQFFEDPRVIITADGPVVGTTASEALIVPDYAIATGELYQGKTYVGHIRGQIGNVITATPTIIFRVRCGTTSLTGTLAVASATYTTRATVATTEEFELDFIVVCRSSGPTGTLFTTGSVTLPNVTGATAAAPLRTLIPQSAPTTSAVDTTVANILGVSAQWSASNAANVLTVKQYVLMAKN